MDYIEKIADALARAFRRGVISMESAGKVTKDLKLRPRFLDKFKPGLESAPILMTSPKHGLQVAKAYDKTSPYVSNDTLRAKTKKSRIFNNRYPDDFAQFYGRSRKHPNITYHEYIPDLNGRPNYQRWAQISKKEGITDADSMGNSVNAKIIDFLDLPTQRDNAAKELHQWILHRPPSKVRFNRVWAEAYGTR